MLGAFPDAPSHCSTVADRPQDAAGRRTNILRSTTLSVRAGLPGDGVMTSIRAAESQVVVCKNPGGFGPNGAPNRKGSEVARERASLYLV